MATHTTGTREEWLAARLRLLQAEKELTRRSDEVARQRQELPWVRLGKEYRFDTDDGSASLAEGVESEAEHRCCCEMGFELGQGYYYGKPMPAPDLPTSDRLRPLF